MSRSQADREEREKLAAEESTRQAKAEAEELAFMNALPLDMIIDRIGSIEDVKYVLRRLARIQQLQLDLIKGHLA